MKILICLLVALGAAGLLHGCSNGSSTTAAAPPAAAVSGIDTPKSVAVVSAN